MTNREKALIRFFNKKEFIDEIKYCPRCDRYLDIILFNSNKSRKDGLASYCYKCATKARDKSEKKHGRHRNDNRKRKLKK